MSHWISLEPGDQQDVSRLRDALHTAFGADSEEATAFQTQQDAMLAADGYDEAAWLTWADTLVARHKAREEATVLQALLDLSRLNARLRDSYVQHGLFDRLAGVAAAKPTDFNSFNRVLISDLVLHFHQHHCAALLDEQGLAAVITHLQGDATLQSDTGRIVVRSVLVRLIDMALPATDENLNTVATAFPDDDVIQKRVAQRRKDGGAAS